MKPEAAQRGAPFMRSSLGLAPGLNNKYYTRLKITLWTNTLAYFFNTVGDEIKVCNVDTWSTSYRLRPIL